MLEASENRSPNPEYKAAFGHRMFNKLAAWNVPWAVGVRIVRGAKTLKTPGEYVRRKAVARRACASSSFAGKVKNEDGYWLFRPDELPGARAAAAGCLKIFGDLQNSGALDELRNNKKKHMRAVLNGDKFAKYPAIGEFVLSRPLIDVAAGYLGTAPILSSICLFWSVENDTAVSSQRYHIDGEDTRQLKLFLNVWDLDDSHGPLTFYPASTTANIVRRASWKQHMNPGGLHFRDQFIVSHANGQKPIRLVGEAGTGAFLDTSRCLHYGSRGNRKERLMLMVQYAAYNMARESTVDLGSTAWIPHDPGDELQRLALRKSPNSA